MLRHEFDNLIKGKKISDEDYKLVEYVYTWYPNISETAGKEQVAWLYKNLGIGVFKDMEARARKYEEMEYELKQAKDRVNKITEVMEALKGGKELWEQVLQ